MSIKRELKIQSLVLLAKKTNLFSPSVFNQYWLDLNKIISAESLDKKSVFSPNLVHALSEKVNIVVTKEQIQIVPTSEMFFKEIITVNSIALINAIKDFEFNGIGLNFNWYITDDEIGYEVLSSKYFYSQSNPGSQFFKDGNPMFGCYMSKDIDSDMRLKLDIKPVDFFDIKKNEKFRAIQFSFNFHSNLNVLNPISRILEIVNNYEKWHEVTAEIVNSYK